MIDFCELNLPCLVLPPDTDEACFRIERRTDGPDWLLCNGQPIARSHTLGAARPCKAGTVIGRQRRGLPVTLLLAATFNEAATDAGQWGAFRAALATLLRHQPGWAVQCETECDQLPLERVEVSVPELLWRLETLRQQPWSPMAFEGACRARGHRAPGRASAPVAWPLALAHVA